MIPKCIHIATHTFSHSPAARRKLFFYVILLFGRSHYGAPLIQELVFSYLQFSQVSVIQNVLKQFAACIHLQNHIYDVKNKRQENMWDTQQAKYKLRDLGFFPIVQYKYLCLTYYYSNQKKLGSRYQGIKCIYPLTYKYVFIQKIYIERIIYLQFPKSYKILTALLGYVSSVEIKIPQLH